MLETKFKVLFLLAVLAFAAIPIMGILRGTTLTPFEAPPADSTNSTPSGSLDPSQAAHEEPVSEEMSSRRSGRSRAASGAISDARPSAASEKRSLTGPVCSPPRHDDRHPPRRGDRAPAGAAAPEHGQPARERDRRGRAPAGLSGGLGRRVRALRARARAGEPRRSDPRAGRGPEPPPSLPHGHRGRRSRRVVGRPVVGRRSTTAASGAAARST